LFGCGIEGQKSEKLDTRKAERKIERRRGRGDSRRNRRKRSGLKTGHYQAGKGAAVPAKAKLEANTIAELEPRYKSKLELEQRWNLRGIATGYETTD
jgi:hypothetical protein